MALVTLSGTISAANLNNNFNDKVASLASRNKAVGKDIQYNLSVIDLTTSLNVGLRTLDFVPPTDLQLVTIGLSMFNPDATSRTAKLTLSAISSEEVSVSKYLIDQVPSATVTGATAAEYDATRAAWNDAGLAKTPIFLVKGITYRLLMTREDANGGNIDRAYGFALCRTVRRYR